MINAPIKAKSSHERFSASCNDLYIIHFSLLVRFDSSHVLLILGIAPEEAGKIAGFAAILSFQFFPTPHYHYFEEHVIKGK